MEEELVFLNRFGELFVKILRQKLDASYDYAPGYDNNAYSNGRNSKYAGSGNKRAGVGFGFQTDLYNSIGYSVNDNNELDISMNSYWRNVNFGREPGAYVPIKPLMYWAAFRLGLNDKEARSAAFAISKNIEKFGVAPTHFYDLAVEEMLSKGTEELGADFVKAITNIINNKLFENDIDFNQDLTINL